jgi:hypothetical protein
LARMETDEELSMRISMWTHTRRQIIIGYVDCDETVIALGIRLES